ncbi:SsrA-binding protein SmpB [Liquorilactobacillus satsumensis]|uniref:SsrA-binding protein n=1 Tax=Liquorilactobacillus satsumensis DSM 16230 = JCM 12392 TaxID=1423801 RepID=A0A0R1V3J9_9LACO|nr:SsrA-binding protein SmpB [Liquorilactobacillus satsumensis]KRL99732.1 SsrA-binding protein [Liquorilactobacillus satsumensis DSM 16230 = JCM 12392]MCC7665736.1 SsrA-binding protein SmpB [Liquorilactobacillus satsumensis]MCP9313456.1 SsrA-binding protein SmpB [Liquorilactobacillus satsumensis]MCP9328251.1 SsrA-binding protein SmpB [Liquorilactobacillus satsumensis]MCP9356470.1 SsrA-binding protein SmpB [Liquorilactobacillus satsumensis]
MAKTKPQHAQPLAQNKKARHDYSIIATFEAGMVLTGTEIKSIRARRINLKDGFAQIRNGEVWLLNVHISPYAQGNQFNHDPLRNRKLLLHKKEIAQLAKQVSDKGITLVPLKVYLKQGFAKVLLGVGKGKRDYDKRETIKRKDQERQIQRTLKNFD